MKIFSFRNMLGAAAAYGAYRYAQSHGGWRQAFDGIVDKIREAAEEREGGSMERSETELRGEREDRGNIPETVSEVSHSYVTQTGDVPSSSRK